jgi:type IV pilus assembly protein PilM
VVVRQLDLDWMPEDHFRQALRYQVADVVPLPVDEANLDHILLDDLEVVDAESGETRRVARILLVAAPRDLVDGMVRAVESAGLRVVRADLAPLALIRASSGGSTTRATGGTGGTEAIVDIGAETVTTTVHRDGRPIFVRFLPGLGGASLTRALQNEFDWTFDEAERTKRASGLLASARHPDDPAPLEHPAQHLLTDLAVELVDEVRATLAFSLDTYDEPSAKLDRVVLTGGGAHLGGLAHLTETVLGVPVVQLDQPTGLRGRGRSPIAQDAAGVSVLATGLALGGVA